MQTFIDGVPSGTRRLVIAAILLVLLTFVFPLSDDDRRSSFDGPSFPPENLLTQPPTERPAVLSDATTPPRPTRPPAPTPTPTLIVSECTPRADWAVYVVRRGDTLAGIAQLVGVPVNDLVLANCLQNPNRIDVNQQIRVPELPSPFITATPQRGG